MCGVNNPRQRQLPLPRMIIGMVSSFTLIRSGCAGDHARHSLEPRPNAVAVETRRGLIVMPHKSSRARCTRTTHAGGPSIKFGRFKLDSAGSNLKGMTAL